MQAWTELYSTSQMSSIHNSSFALSSTLTEATPLSSIQQGTGLSISFPSSSSTLTGRAQTLTFLENQVSRSLSLQFSHSIEQPTFKKFHNKNNTTKLIMIS